MANNRFYFISMVALVLGLGYLTYQVIRPFLAPIAWAIVLSIVFYPLYIFILRYVRWRSIASLITLFIIILIIIGPFSYVSYLLVSEIQNISGSLNSGTIESIKDLMDHPGIRHITGRISSLFNISITGAELNKALIDGVSRLGKEIVRNIPVGLGNVMTVLAEFIFMAFAVFFILKDGADFLKRSRNYMPFSEEQKGRLATQIRDIIVSTIYGGVIVAIIQGIIGGIAYALLGIQSPVLWGLSTAIASFVPLLGTFAVWGVITMYFFIQGAIWKGSILLLVGIFGISMVDNILKPVLIGARTRMHILVIFFSVLGGINLFGLIGLIMGPLVVALFISVVEIFRNFEGGYHA
ncbi:MAG: AI-2E family transporter [Nitrospirae bacterium]|nr:AI-2E family transporter [Nitrospirota bacterium]MCL5238235.1 AI-2E family transporter [Nitrospirota bacterium]